MAKGKVIRQRTILTQPALEELIALNVTANKLGYEVFLSYDYFGTEDARPVYVAISLNNIEYNELPKAENRDGMLDAIADMISKANG